jgi:hypothetical protein
LLIAAINLVKFVGPEDRIEIDAVWDSHKLWLGCYLHRHGPASLKGDRFTLCLIDAGYDMAADS